MSDLTGKKIANTYKDLLQIDSATDNAGIDGTLRRVQDGDGTNSALELSQNAAKVNGNVEITGTLSVGSIALDGLTVSALTATDITTTNITVDGDGVATSSALASVEAIISSNIVFVLNAQASVLTVIAGLSATDTQLQNNIDSVSATTSANGVLIASNSTQINNLSTSIAANASAIAVNESAITSVNTRINAVSILAETKASAATSANLETRINSVSANLVSTSAALQADINTVSATLSSTNVALQTSIANVSSTMATSIANVSAALQTQINTANTSIAANTSLITALSGTLETRINGVSVLAETKASASTSANLETRINSVSVLAETKASAATSATLETRIAGVSSTFAATSATLATSIANHLPLAGGTLTGDLVLNADPDADLKAATKQYVDNLVASGIHYHEPVRLEQPGAVSATYDNGAAGVGATLTNAGTQAILVVDGVTVANDDRILIYEQTDATQNGVYVATTVGSPSTNWVLTRSADTDSTGDKDANTLDEGSYFFVEEGNTGAGESYVCNTVVSIVFGTTDITFVQFSSALAYTAGSGISITGDRVISTSGVPTDAELAAVSATLESRIATVSSTMATSIANVSSTLESRIATVSSTMATSIATVSSTLESRIAGVSAIVPTSLTELGISDGTAGQFLQTNGSSVFTFASVAGGGGGISTLTAGTNIALTENGTTVTDATASATINVVGVASAGTSAALETRIAAVSVLTGTNAAAITSINGATYRPNTALSATTGTFTGVVSAPRVVATSAVIGTPSQWAIYVSSNNLKMDYNGTTRLRLTTTGALQVADDLEAFTTLT